MIQTEVSKVLNDEEYLKRLIEAEVIRQCKRESPYRSYITCTVDQVYRKIDSVIHEEVLKRLKIELLPPGESSGNENIDSTVTKFL